MQPLTIRSFQFGKIAFEAALPISSRQERGAALYWGKLWPAAIALCGFIADHGELVQDKTVLELAAGLGFPALVAAHFANRVLASDCEQEAVALMQENLVDRNGLRNLSCERLDWSALPEEVFGNEVVLLLSDINYDPAQFEVLYTVLLRFLNGGSTILLSTPQRLMAKPFITRLLPFVVAQDERFIETETESAWVSIFRLEKT